jgi:hypothetical protein
MFHKLKKIILTFLLASLGLLSASSFGAGVTIAQIPAGGAAKSTDLFEVWDSTQPAGSRSVSRTLANIFSPSGDLTLNPSGNVVIPALKTFKTNIFDVTSGSSFDFSNRDITNVDQLTAFQLIGTNSVLSDAFTATSNVSTPNVIASTNLALSPNDDLILDPGSGNVTISQGSILRFQFDVGAYNTLTSSDALIVSDAAWGYQFSSAHPQVLLSEVTGPSGDGKGRLFLGDGTSATTGVHLSYGGTSGTLIVTSGSAASGAATINTASGTVIAQTFTNNSDIDITPSAGSGSGNLNITGIPNVTIASGSNDFYTAKVSGDSASRFSVYKGTNQTAMLLGNGSGNGSYLSYKGANGTLKITSTSNGTGDGSLDLGAGTVTAGTFAQGSSGFTLDGVDLVLSGSTGITFPTIGGVAVPLSYYEYYSNNITLSGIWAGNETAIINITRTGSDVHIWLGGGILANATTSAVISAPAGSIPTRFLGLNDGVWSSFARIPFLIRDNGTDKLGNITINQDGSFTISAGPSTVTAFAGSGASGFPGQGFGWSL